MNDIVWLLIFFITFVVTCLLLNHIERKMWKDWFDGKIVGGMYYIGKGDVQ